MSDTPMPVEYLSPRSEPKAGNVGLRILAGIVGYLGVMSLVAYACYVYWNSRYYAPRWEPFLWSEILLLPLGFMLVLARTFKSRAMALAVWGTFLVCLATFATIELSRWWQ